MTQHFQRARSVQTATMKRLILILLSVAVLAACSGKTQPAAAATTAQPPATAPKAKPQQAANLTTGKIIETINAAGYTYVHFATAEGEKWAAVRETQLKKGDDVTIAVEMVAENFESKTLGRKFDKIIFGSVSGGVQPAMASMAPPPPVTATADIHVEKAKGGKSVAEVWAGKSTLQDKPVVIRGKVVKFLPEIMGKNWMHLRDGSGSQAKGDNDLTVTTKDVANVGDVVTVTGTLRVDKDFGSGYRYGVIVEDAKVQK